MLLPAVQAAREAARRASCLNKVRNIALACVNYESSNQQFPAAISSAGESYLVRILPMLDQQPLYDGFRASGSVNPLNDLSENQIDTFICDSTTRMEAEADNMEGRFTSHYATSSGPISLDTNGPYTIADGFVVAGGNNGMIGLRGLFSPADSSDPFARRTKRGVATSDVTDGMSNTLAIIESSRSASPSTNGGASFSIRNPRWTFGIENSNGNRIDWSRGVARTINSFDVPDGSDGFTAQPLHEQCISSNHPGGANVANGDGSTHFVSQDTSLEDVENQNLDL